MNYRADRGVWEVLHSDTASYPGLPCCYQTRLVQFESLKREALRKAGLQGSYSLSALNMYKLSIGGINRPL